MNTKMHLSPADILKKFVFLTDDYKGAHIAPNDGSVAMDEVWIISGADDAHIVGYLYYDDMETAWDIHCRISEETIFSTSLMERGVDGAWVPSFDFG